MKYRNVNFNCFTGCLNKPIRHFVNLVNEKPDCFDKAKDSLHKDLIALGVKPEVIISIYKELELYATE